MSVKNSGNFLSAPEEIILEVLDSGGCNLTYSDLGPEFCEDFGLKARAKKKPFKISMSKKCSKSGGNAYYEYSQQSVPLPDGLSTLLRVNGFLIPMGKQAKSKTGGYLQRMGNIELDLDGEEYRVTAYITKSKSPFYINLAVIKKPNTKNNKNKVIRAPKGGSLIV